MRRRSLHRIHRWAGLVALVLVLLQSLTGLAISFRDEINRALYPAVRESSLSPRLPLDAMIGSVRERFPAMRLQRVIFPTTREEPYWFRLAPRDGGSRYFVLVDPTNNQILRHGPLVLFPCELAVFIHATLLAGSAGPFVVGIAGMALLLLGVSGAMLWWPRSGPLLRHMQVRRGQPKVVTLLELHRAVGICSAIGLIMLAFTGALVALRPLLPAPAPRFDVIARQSVMTTQDTMDWVERALPGTSVSIAYFRDEPGACALSAIDVSDPSLPHARARHRLTFDAANPAVVRSLRYEDSPLSARLFDWLLPIHSGEVAGLGGRLVVFVLGVCLTFIAVTGVWMWRVRRAALAKHRKMDLP